MSDIPISKEFLLDERRIEVLQYTKAMTDAVEEHLTRCLIDALLEVAELPMPARELQRFAETETQMLLARLRDVDYFLSMAAPPQEETDWDGWYGALVRDMNAFLHFFRVERPLSGGTAFNPYGVSLEFPPNVRQTIQLNLAHRTESARAYRDLVEAP